MPIVLIPLKTFEIAKGRLGDHLSAAKRASLAQRLAEGVIAAASPWPVVVVCDDDGVAAFADARGASVLRVEARGLNAAISDALVSLPTGGATHVIIAHGDLADPSALRALPLGDGITIVPDRSSDGTNVLALPALVARSFTPHYGVGSFNAHLAEAQRCGLTITVHSSEGLAFDIDRPEDFEEAQRRQLWPALGEPET
jgi:2-phospho-L-lactate/phosphoenolpyruvate guanylyltransferase